MLLIFRAVAVNGVARRFASSANSSKLNLDSHILDGISCRCKFAQNINLSARRDYSTKSGTTSVSEASSSENVEDREVIYKGLLSGSIRRLKILSLTTSTVGIGVQPIIYNKMLLAGEVSAMTLPLFGCVALFAISTPPLLHMVTKRYINLVEYNHKNDKYIATNYNLFAFKKKTEFTPDDVTIPTVQGLFTNCAIKGKPCYLDSAQFTDQSHYVRIMGYDKPLEIEVEDNQVDSDDEDWSKNNNKKAK